tara:strand:- start:5624 stop:5875 length:252 start_codon:yes stop_codon:yes gene_type:complete
MSDETQTEQTEQTETTPTTEQGPSLRDPDGDGKPGISWPAAAVLITIIAALAGMIVSGQIPDEVLVLLLGGMSEHVRGRVVSR